MSSFPGSPRLIKGGIVVINPDTAAIEKIIPLQYNPDTLTRSFQVKGVGDASGNRSEPLRLSGPPVETLKLEAEIDATDKMESGDAQTSESGIQPELAVLEMLIYPKSSQLNFNNTVAILGSIEIIPMDMPLTLFVWNKNRIIPVRLTEFSVTEEAFDPFLNPIRAKVSLGMRVLSVDDLGFNNKGGNLYMSYQQNKERLASKFNSGTLQSLGINAI